MSSVYLAGPIRGTSYTEATTWRQIASRRLYEANIDPLSPLRYKSYLAGEMSISDSYGEHTLSTAQGITTRDRFDVQRCDVVLMNLLGSGPVSIGTMIEAGWADAYRKPVVLVMQDGNVHDHAILRTISGFVVTTLDAGLDVAIALLSVGVAR